MSPPMTDRNLLVAMLAVQLYGLRREQVQGALQQWMEDGGRNLEQILVDAGLLSGEAAEQLSALTSRRVQEPVGLDARGVWQVLLDSVAVRQDEQTTGWASSGAQGVPTDTWHATGHKLLEGRFRVLRPHAKGGLGTVSVARDLELPREVALKEIQDRYADDPHARQRFLIEAEITGGLEHPGIVPVYALGRDPQGRLYYAMRLVRGFTLGDAIEQLHREVKPNMRFAHSLGFRKLLSRFIAVCDALEYAHSRGVIHRDLKPGNIMLGKYGETLVVDWGLAKSLGTPETPGPEPVLEVHSAQDTSPTVMGSAIGTPEYMSPEQAEGRLDLLQPATDVYGLGAILYSILTARPPVSAPEREEVFARVRRGAIRWPEESNPWAPKDLAAVCRKAMALRPEDRYGSARALAEDVERWLAEEPVSARRPNWSESVWRWTRRHRLFVSVVVMSLLIASLALAISNTYIRHARDVAQQERRAADEARDTAHRERREAITARGVAEGQRLRAEKASQAARQNAAAVGQVIEQFLLKIGDREWARVPGTEQLRIGMVEQAVERYRQLLAQAPNEETFVPAAATALRQLANLYRMVDRVEDARKHYQEATQLSQKVLEIRPGDRRAWQSHLELLADAAGLEDRVSGATVSAPLWRAVLAAAAQANQEFPDDAALRQIEARAHGSMAEVLYQLGEDADSLDLARKAAETFSDFADVPDAPLASRLSALVSWYSLGRIARRVDQPAVAEEALTEAIRRTQTYLQQEGNEANGLYFLAVSLLERARMLRAGGAAESAASAADQGLGILQALAAQSQQTAHFQRSYAEALTMRGELALDRGDIETAESDGEQAVESLSQQLADSKQSAQYELPLAQALTLRARAHAAREDKAAARASLERAAELLQKAKLSSPGNRDTMRLAEEVEMLLD